MDHRYFTGTVQGLGLDLDLPKTSVSSVLLQESLVKLGPVQVFDESHPGLSFAQPALFCHNQVPPLPSLLGAEVVTAHCADLTGCSFGLSKQSHMEHPGKHHLLPLLRAVV